MSLPPFQALLDDHADALYRYLRRAAGPDADDCFQETVVAALRAYPTLGHAGNLRGWLFTIAHRKAVDRHRGTRRTIPVETAPDPGHEAPDGDPELWAAVAALPDKQRGAVTLRYVGDLSHREIGEALGCSEAAARQNVRVGLARLREVMT